MALIQYHCPKHPEYTKRGTVPNGMADPEYSKENFNKGKINWDSMTPVCPKCRQEMEPLWSRNKGNKYIDGVDWKLDENFNKSLKWNIKKDKKKKGKKASK